jgi:hypothetical protein
MSAKPRRLAAGVARAAGILRGMIRLALAAAIAIAVASCGGGAAEQSDAERIRSLDEELSTLPDPGPGLGEAGPPPIATEGWRTDFAKRSVPLSEFQSGGPGKDGSGTRSSTTPSAACRSP